MQLVGSAQLDPEFAQAFRETFVSRRRETVVSVLRRGQERGEVDASIDLEAAADLLYGPIWYRRLVRHAPLNAAFARELAGTVVVAVAPR